MKLFKIESQLKLNCSGYEENKKMTSSYFSFMIEAFTSC